MSTWPSEPLPRPAPIAMDPGQVTAYYLSPSEPEYTTVEETLRQALLAACERFDLRSILSRAVTSRSPMIVHAEIWNWLYHADLLVFDITGQNGSVMMELGVAAAWRLKPQILILQNRSRGERLIPPRPRQQDPQRCGNQQK